MAETKRWLSSVPGFCELCDGPIIKVFYDAKTRQGPWACMCKSCHTKHGSPLGLGKGQEYTENKFGHWIKTNG